MPNLRNSGSSSNLGAASAAIWDCRAELQKRQHDRTGQLIGQDMEAEEVDASGRPAQTTLDLPDHEPALHGARPPAIDTDEVVRANRQLWLIVLRGLTPKQLEGHDLAREELQHEMERARG